MRYHVNDIYVNFNPICPDCKAIQIDGNGKAVHDSVNVSITHLIDSGTPVCCECGSDLTLQDYADCCRSNRTVATDEQLEQIAEQIADGLDYNDTTELVNARILDSIQYASEEHLKDNFPEIMESE